MGAIGSPTEATDVTALPIVRLTKIGFKLAVLGIKEGATSTEDARWWHVMRPGTLGATDMITGHRYGRTLCGVIAVSNGYASDFTPPDKAFCPACKEHV